MILSTLNPFTSFFAWLIWFKYKYHKWLMQTLWVVKVLNRNSWVLCFWWIIYCKPPVPPLQGLELRIHCGRGDIINIKVRDEEEIHEMLVWGHNNADVPHQLIEDVVTYRRLVYQARQNSGMKGRVTHVPILGYTVIDWIWPKSTLLQWHNQTTGRMWMAPHTYIY